MELSARDELQRQMCALRDGDRGAFALVYAQVWPLVQRFAHRLVGQSADAEDAAQQALLKVFGRIMHFDPQREALPWILGIAYNECRSLRQQQRRTADKEQAITHAHDLPTTDRDPEEATMSQDLHELLRDVMGNLRQDDIDTLWAGAGRMERPDIPAATFRKRFQRALARLKIAWEKRHEHL